MAENLNFGNEAKKSYAAMRVSKLGELVELTQQMDSGGYFDGSPTNNPMFMAMLMTS